MYQQNNMKKILFILLLLPFISKAQLEQNHPEPGGHLFVGVRSTSWLRPPSDTATNKTGIARIGTALYIGNGTYWSASGLIYTGTTPISVSGTVISMAQASAIASGYLSSTDWSLFNAKQDALVSGTNIKTVNSSSILGSGNLSVGTVTGTGTANTMTKFTGTSSIGNSIVTDDGTNVGVGTASPGAQFGVNKSAYFNIQNSNKVYVGSVTGSEGYPGIWLGSAAPSLSNYAFLADVGAGQNIVNATTNVDLRISNASKASLTSTSFTHLTNVLFTDNTYDIGASGATRPRTGYFGTSINVAGATLTGTTFQLPTFTLQNSNAVQVMSSYDNVYAYIMRAFTGRTDVSGTKTLLTVGESFSWLPNAANTATYSNTLFNSTLNPGVSNSGGTFENVKSKVIETTTTGLTARYLYSGYSGVAGTTQKFYVNTDGDGYFAGNVGIGTASPAAKLHTISTTEQLRIGYDASNYYSTTVGSTGIATFNAVGSGSSFEFSDRVAVPKLKGNSSTPSIAGGAGAGTAPTVSITGTDLAGEITVTTDSDPSTGNKFCTVTFATAFSSAPYVVIYPSNDNAIIDLTKFQAGLYVTSTTTTFVLNTNSITAPTISSEMKFMYHVIQ